MNIAEVKAELKVMKELRVAGKILTMVKGRKRHKCCVCPMPIEAGETHCAIIQGGGGLGWIKYPDRIHLDCIDNYFGKKEGKDDH
ncbi:MAG: hypothetical protein MUO99_00875 [Dehalococcoidales bacterium]|nr:hypothetical protein [Dehalococcoidales bacterium]